MNITKSFLFSMLVLLFICGCSGVPKEEAGKPQEEATTPPPRAGATAPEKVKTIQELVLQLNTTSGDQRQEASIELRKRGKEALPQLLPMLDDPKAETRLNAAVALGEIGPPAADPAIPRLQELADTDPDENIRKAAGNAVKQIQVRL